MWQTNLRESLFESEILCQEQAKVHTISACVKENRHQRLKMGMPTYEGEACVAITSFFFNRCPIFGQHTRFTYQMVARSHATPTLILCHRVSTSLTPLLDFAIFIGRLRFECSHNCGNISPYKLDKVKDPAEPNHARRECTNFDPIPTILGGVNP